MEDDEGMVFACGVLSTKCKQYARRGQSLSLSLHRLFLLLLASVGHTHVS